MEQPKRVRLTNDNHDLARGPCLPGHTDLRLADFSGQDLGGRKFTRCDLRGASFAEADCTGASFRRSSLQRADFTGADLRGADLRRRQEMRYALQGVACHYLTLHQAHNATD